MEDYLMHHGVLGQKWGIRRYQNADGSLTEAGKKHLGKISDGEGLNKKGMKLLKGDKQAVITKGTKLYRVSTNKSDLGNDKIYATVDKKQHEFYVDEFTKGNIINKGKEYCQELVAKNDIFLPDKKTMEKIELNLLKDKDVQKELVTSLMKKGLTREEATEKVRPYSAGKAAVEKSLVTLGAVAYTSLGAAFTTAGAVTGVWPAAIEGGLLTGLGARLTVDAIKAPTTERTRALGATRVSYGDKANKVTNAKLREELQKQGYNAMKDYNDRRAFGKEADSAVIVLDSNKNLKTGKSTQMTAKQYGEIYADKMMKLHETSGYKKNVIDRADYVQDGIREFKEYEKAHLINEGKKADQKRYLEAGKKSNKKS